MKCILDLICTAYRIESYMFTPCLFHIRINFWASNPKYLPYRSSRKLSASSFWIGHCWWQSWWRYRWISRKSIRRRGWSSRRWASSRLNVFRHLGNIWWAIFSWPQIPCRWCSRRSLGCRMTSSYSLNAIICLAVWSPFPMRRLVFLGSFYWQSLLIRICHCFLYSLGYHRN